MALCKTKKKQPRSINTMIIIKLKHDVSKQRQAVHRDRVASTFVQSKGGSSRVMQGVSKRALQRWIVCKRVGNNRHTVTLGIPLQSYF
jgi:hypothetical protein